MENVDSPWWQKGQRHMQEILVGSVKLRASHQHSSLLRLPGRKQSSAQGSSSPSDPMAAPISSLQGAQSFLRPSPLKEHSVQRELTCSITFLCSRWDTLWTALAPDSVAGMAAWLPLALALG